MVDEPAAPTSNEDRALSVEGRHSDDRTPVPAVIDGAVAEERPLLELGVVGAVR
jgi:hypothetical protein